MALVRTTPALVRAVALGTLVASVPHLIYHTVNLGVLASMADQLVLALVLALLWYAERMESASQVRTADGERLKEIPASRTKRRVVLKWLAKQFEPDHSYPEPVVNEVLKRHHPDAATLRRKLIDYGLMTRANGIYRRPAAGDGG